MTITEQNFSKSVETRSVTWNPFTLLGQLSETRYWAYLLIIPSLILISAVVIYPILSGISLSFHMMRLNRPDLGMDYIGLEHYRKLLEDRTFRAALTNTLIWVVGGVVSQFSLGMITALALNQSLRGVRIARSVVMLPWIMPTVIAGNIWALR